MGCLDLWIFAVAQRTRSSRVFRCKNICFYSVKSNESIRGGQMMERLATQPCGKREKSIELIIIG